MTETLLGVAPRFDAATDYSIKWCRETLDKIKGKLSIIRLFDQNAIRGKVLAEMKKDPKPLWFVHYDHGSEYAMWGDDEKKIIDLSNLGVLSGTHTYCMNCSSGKGLGSHAQGAGLLEYWGYVDTVSFTTDAAKEFGEAFGWGLVEAVIQGVWLKEVLEEAREHGYDVADKLGEEGKVFAAANLVRDMKILRCYYRGGPQPPPPRCPFSRLVWSLFGWKRLRILRGLRQWLRGGWHD